MSSRTILTRMFVQKESISYKLDYVNSMFIWKEVDQVKTGIVSCYKEYTYNTGWQSFVYMYSSGFPGKHLEKPLMTLDQARL